jgi:tryptophan 7-halogenase
VDNPTRKVVIVGGGTAGWLTACLLARRAKTIEGTPPDIVLVESPDIPPIGVGEGTWPSMRMSLQAIGIAESDLVRHADASFKQGTQFIGWGDNDGSDSYYHPFSLPAEYSQLNLAEYWLDLGSRPAFADFATPQARVIAAGLAPRQASMPPYAFAVNYAYHFDAGKFAVLLHEHATARLGVDFRAANVVAVAAADNGDIAAVELDSGERIDGDLFVDCTGQRSLLLAGHFGVDFISVKDVLLNDTAIAVQVPWGRNSPPLPSVTRATAAPAGWIWDIGLQSRRGIGYVHSSAHTDEGAALATLKNYIARTAPAVSSDGLGFRTIRFEPGYRRDFWVRNCVAVGLSGGFIEPLEASALALIEQAAQLISRDLPVSRDIMTVVAKRFNEKMHYHWQRVVEFLKLHYVLSRRDESAYWRDTRNPSTCPAGLRDKLTLWQQQAPWHEDAPRVDELFPSASYQFVLYGMGFEPALRAARRSGDARERALVEKALKENDQRARQLLSGLPANRALLDAMTSLAGVA